MRHSCPCAFLRGAGGIHGIGWLRQRWLRAWHWYAWAGTQPGAHGNGVTKELVTKPVNTETAASLVPARDVRAREAIVGTPPDRKPSLASAIIPSRRVTPVTPSQKMVLPPEPAWILAVTRVTPVTPKKIKVCKVREILGWCWRWPALVDAGAAPALPPLRDSRQPVCGMATKGLRAGPVASASASASNQQPATSNQHALPNIDAA